MSAAQDRRDQWVAKWHCQGVGQPAGLLRIIVADGGLGTAGATDHKKMTPRTADHILRLVVNSGVAPGPGREYLARLLRWHYGFSSGGPVASSAKLDQAAAEFIRRRAHELITAHDESLDGPLVKIAHPELAR